jgi:hypothetical protein
MFAALPLQARLRLAFAATALLLGGCGSAPTPPPYDAVPGGTKLEPASAAESDVLKRLDSLAPNQPTPIAGATVTAELPYFSASGRTCRWVTTTLGKAAVSSRRLACKEAPVSDDDDGERQSGQWFFVPDVFTPPAPAAADPPGAQASAESPAPPAERLAPLPEDD